MQLPWWSVYKEDGAAVAAERTRRRRRSLQAYVIRPDDDRDLIKIPWSWLNNIEILSTILFLLRTLLREN